MPAFGQRGPVLGDGPPLPPFDPICNAPFSSMYLDPLGVARACCHNRMHVLGDVREQTLSEIWRGEATQRLRDRLVEHDLGLGCEECAVALRNGDDATVLLHSFDPVPAPEPRPAWPIQLELSLSNACNLQCAMCNGDLSSSIRIHREHRPALPKVYGERFFAELQELLPTLQRIVFMGGEPFLASESLRVMDLLVDGGHRPATVVITNGTHWNDRIERIVRTLPIHVSVSVDGVSAELVEAIRVGVDHAALVANIVRFREVARSQGNGMQLTSCLMVETWSELGALCGWADELDVELNVKRVLYPTRSSIYHLPTEELRTVVQALEAEDVARRPQLRRNRSVWIDELTSLQRALAGRDHEAATSVRIRGSVEGTRSLAVLQAVHEAPGAATVEADADNLIVIIEPDPTDVCGIDASDLIGQGMEQLTLRMIEVLGLVDDSTVERLDHGVEVRHLTFGSGARAAVLTAVQESIAGGSRWHLALSRQGQG